MYLHYHDDSEADQSRRQRQASVAGYAASLAGRLALPAALPQAAFQVASSAELLFQPKGTNRFLVRDQLGPYFADLVDRSPALPLLAVRAARRAVAADPGDGNAWLRLGQAYLLLRNVTGERSAEGLLPPLAQLRQVQIANALEQALRLDSDLEAAHYELAYVYAELNCFDQAVAHQREALRLSRRAGPRPGESAAQQADRLEALEKDVSKSEDSLRVRRKVYASAVPTLHGDRLGQAALALKFGLARQALDEILLPAPADLLGPPGIRKEWELLLMLGRVEELRAFLNDEQLRASKEGLLYSDLPPPKNRDGGDLYPLPYHWLAYDWLHMLQTAAVGDYVQAREALRALRSGLQAGHDRMGRQLQAFPRRAAPLLPGLWSGPPPFLPALAAQSLGQLVKEKEMLQAAVPVLRAQQADVAVLEGLLALEQGATERARAAFADAYRLGAEVPFAGRPIAARYLARLQPALAPK
jgi:hypothetical protein